jgi:hypothetical protein
MHEIAVRVKEVSHWRDKVHAGRDFEEHRLQRLEVFVRLVAQLEAVEPLVPILVDGNFLRLPDNLINVK